jgi:hypothetical protein
MQRKKFRFERATLQLLINRNRPHLRLDGADTTGSYSIYFIRRNWVVAKFCPAVFEEHGCARIFFA